MRKIIKRTWLQRWFTSSFIIWTGMKWLILLWWSDKKNILAFRFQSILYRLSNPCWELLMRSSDLEDNFGFLSCYMSALSRGSVQTTKNLNDINTGIYDLTTRRLEMTVYCCWQYLVTRRIEVIKVRTRLVHFQSFICCLCIAFFVYLIKNK